MNIIVYSTWKWTGLILLTDRIRGEKKKKKNLTKSMANL